MQLRSLKPSRSSVLATIGGLLVAASLPPWGFWPLAFVGIGVFEMSLGVAPTGRQRLVRGWLFGAAWLYPGLCWMWFLSAPGYLVAAALFAGLHAFAAWVAPSGSWRVIGRPAAHTLVEVLRFSFPFGGVPLASLPIGQAGGPLLGVARVGGVVLFTWFVFQIGFALAGPSPVVPALAKKRGVTAKGEWHGVIGFAAAIGVLLVSPLADGEFGQEVKSSSTRIAVVQGGGPQGTHAIDTSAREVVERHLAATATIEAGSADLVLWPENVVDVDLFEGSAELAEISAEAARIGAPFVVGVTEDTPDGTRFVNAQVVVTPGGDVVSRYEKVIRVPFGEYMPMRGLLRALGAPTDLVPRDARAGTGPAFVELPDGTRLGVVISWEVFFGGRVAEGVKNGATIVVNPTNGSSYTWTVLQSQQVASSRLRAVEQNRWVVQAAPTGFSAFVSPTGEVFQRTSVSEQEVITRAVELREMRTWYSHAGDSPFVALMLLLFGLSWRVQAGEWVRHRRGPAVAPGVSPPAE